MERFFVHDTLFLMTRRNIDMTKSRTLGGTTRLHTQSDKTTNIIQMQNKLPESAKRSEAFPEDNQTTTHYSADSDEKAYPLWANCCWHCWGFGIYSENLRPGRHDIGV